MSIVFRNQDGDKITGTSAVLLQVLVLPSNFFILSYVAMILFGVLHSYVQPFPALGFWPSACVFVLFQILGWKKGPITWDGIKK